MAKQLLFTSEIESKVKLDAKERFDSIFTLFDEEHGLKEFLSKRSYLAGGSLRSIILDEKINDLDIFFMDDESLEIFEELLFDEDGNINISLGKNWSFKETVNSYSFFYETSQYPTIQFIKLHTGMPSQMIKDFDFTCNMNFYIPSLNYLYIEDLEAIEKKEIVVNINNCSVVNTFYRLFKFMKSGWKVSGRSLGTMTILLSNHEPLSSLDEVQSHLLMGMSDTNFSTGGSDE